MVNVPSPANTSYNIVQYAEPKSATAGSTMLSETILEDTVACTGTVVYYDTMTVCDGEIIEIDGQQISTTGDYEFEYGTNGCDSILYLHVDILPVVELYDTAEICTGETLYYLDSTITTAGLYIFFIPSQDCDTTLYLEVFEYGLGAQLAVTPGSCDGTTLGSVTINGWQASWISSLDGGPYLSLEVYSGLTPGMYTMDIQDTEGCTWFDSFTIPNGVRPGCRFAGYDRRDNWRRAGTYTRYYLGISNCGLQLVAFRRTELHRLSIAPINRHTIGTLSVDSDGFSWVYGHSRDSNCSPE